MVIRSWAELGIESECNVLSEEPKFTVLQEKNLRFFVYFWTIKLWVFLTPCSIPSCSLTFGFVHFWVCHSCHYLPHQISTPPQQLFFFFSKRILNQGKDALRTALILNSFSSTLFQGRFQFWDVHFDYIPKKQKNKKHSLRIWVMHGTSEW